MSKILLCNYNTFDKLEAHKSGLQHFAFSVFLFNKKGELLLQRRAKNKYHSGGLWSNSCCSHFKNLYEFNKKDFTIKERIQFELGIGDVYDLNFIDSFSYNVALDNNLYENEVDDVFVGFIQETIANIKFNVDEVDNIMFINFDDLLLDVNANASKYTAWLKLILEKQNIIAKIKEKLSFGF